MMAEDLEEKESYATKSINQLLIEEEYMNNRIPRTATKLDVVFKIETNTGKSGTHMIAEKEDNRWIGTDDNGKRWHLFVSHLRNGDLCSIKVLDKSDNDCIIVEGIKCKAEKVECLDGKKRNGYIFTVPGWEECKIIGLQNTRKVICARLDPAVRSFYGIAG